MSEHILKNDNKTLQNLIYHLDELKEFNSLLARHIAEPEIAKHCHIVKFDRNCLIVVVDNGNWATQLRFHIPELMVKLRQYPRLENLSGIVCKTRPNTSLPKSSKAKKRVIPQISSQTVDTLLATVQTIQDAKLRGIMEKIAEHLRVLD